MLIINDQSVPHTVIFDGENYFDYEDTYYDDNGYLVYGDTVITDYEYRERTESMLYINGNQVNFEEYNRAPGTELGIVASRSVLYPTWTDVASVYAVIAELEAICGLPPRFTAEYEAFLEHEASFTPSWPIYAQEVNPNPSYLPIYAGNDPLRESGSRTQTMPIIAEQPLTPAKTMVSESHDDNVNAGLNDWVLIIAAVVVTPLVIFLSVFFRMKRGL